MKKIKSIAMTALLLLAGATISYAHGDKGPHGGQMVTTGNYSVELLNKDGEVSVYLLDAFEKPISNKNVTGTITLKFADKTSESVKLTSKGDDGFSVSNNRASTFLACDVILKVNGKTVTANFIAIVEKKKEPEVKPHHHDHDEEGHQH